LTCQSATPAPPTHDTCGQSGLGERSAGRADGPKNVLGPPEPPCAPSTCAGGPRCTGRQSTWYGRTVRPTAMDSPTSLYLFSLIYFEILI
jgi:hypothetical protein